MAGAAGGNASFAQDDRRRWARHLEPEIGHLVPDAVDTGTIRKLVEKKLAEGLSPATCLLLVRLLSTFYTDLIENHHATNNPARMLPKGTKKLIRPTYDPKRTPFVEKRDDIARVYQAIPPPVNIAYALSALAGLRPGSTCANPSTAPPRTTTRASCRSSTASPRCSPRDARRAQATSSWRH